MEHSLKHIISAKLCEDSNITHTCGNEYLFISLANALADNLYIVCGDVYKRQAYRRVGLRRFDL